MTSKFEDEDLFALIEWADIAMFVKDLDGRYLQINRPGARMLGREIEEIIGADDKKLFASTSAELMLERDRQILAGRQIRRYQSIAHTGGRWKHFQSVKGALRDRNGRYNTLVGFSVDRTLIRLQSREDLLSEIAKTLSHSPGIIRKRLVETF